MPFKDIEKRKAYDRARSDSARHAVYAAAHREEARARARAWRAANPERSRATVKAYRRSHPKQVSEWEKASKKRRQALMPEVWVERAARRRAQKQHTQTEKVDFKQILRDSKGLCGICNKPLDLFGIEFDHIVPLARGGSHTRENIQATHSRCNRVKGAKVG